MSAKEKYGLVVLLDALGTSTASIHESAHYLTVVKALKARIKVSLETTLRSHQDDPKLMSALTNLRPRFFGDSVLLTYEITDQELFVGYLARILFIINLLIVEAIGQRILFRGAIGIGQYVEDADVVLGPAVADVAHWYEKMDMIGVMLTPTTANIIRSRVRPVAKDKYDDERPVADFVQWQSIPTKTGLVDGYLLDWPHFVRFSCKKDNGKALQWYYDQISEFIVAPGTESKYSHTDAFFRASLQRSAGKGKRRSKLPVTKALNCTGLPSVVTKRAHE